MTDLHCFQLHLLRTREFKMTPKARRLRLQEAQAKFVKKQMRRSSCSFFAFMNEVSSASRSQLSLTTHPITGEPGPSWYLSAPTGGIDTGNITLLFLRCYGPTLSPHHVLQWSQTPIINICSSAAVRAKARMINALVMGTE